MRKNRIKIISGLQRCVPYSDYTKAVWSNCTYLDCLQFKELPCEQILCQERREGECKEDFSFIIKIGEPFLRGITEFTYTIEKRDDSTNGTWKEVKKERVYLQGVTQDLENYFKVISYNMINDYDNVYGNIYYRISYVDNINTNKRFIQGIFECLKPAPPMPESSITILGKGNLAMLTNDNEVIQVSISGGTNPYFDMVYKEATFVLEAFENNQWVEKDRVTTSEKSVDFTKSWRDVLLQELRFRSKIDISYNYDYLQPSHLNTGEVILRKHQKTMQYKWTNPLHYSTTGKFIDEGEFGITEARPTTNFGMSDIIRRIDTDTLISSVNRTYRKIIDDGEETYLNIFSDIISTHDRGTIYNNSIDPNSVVYPKEFPTNFSKIEFKFTAVINYKYEYLESDTIISPKAVIYREDIVRGADKRCVEEMRDGQLVKTNEVVYDNREFLINGVVIRKEPNTTGPNHISSYTDEVECKTEYLPRFDNILLHFIWTDKNGVDLDLKVGNQHLGFVGFCGDSRNDWNKYTRTPYYVHYKDNTSSPGQESVYIRFDLIDEYFKQNNINDNIINFELNNSWYSSTTNDSGYDGHFKILLEGFLGGTIVQNGTVANNVGGTKVFDVEKIVTSLPKNRNGCSPIRTGSIYYNRITKDARLEIV